MIPILQYSTLAGRQRVDQLLRQLRLDPVQLAMAAGTHGKVAADVSAVVGGVASRGDEAIVDISRRFDVPDFRLDQIRVNEQEMAEAALNLTPELESAIRRSIEQVAEYQRHVMPAAPPVLRRPGVTLGLRFTPLDSVGLFVPGGKAAYPSSLIMLAVPAIVAGVKRIVVCTPPSSAGRNQLVFAVCHQLGLQDVFRASGTAAIAAMAFGTATIPAVDKIVGPGNLYVQFAKRMISGAVGIDGFLGPSEILTIADDSAVAAFVAADILAQAEHDPGSSILLTTSQAMADAVAAEVASQFAQLSRRTAIEASLANSSAIVVDPSMDRLLELANQFAAEHVNIQTRDNAAILDRLRHGGAIFVGPYSPVAAGDYIAGPSHSLPTNTTARFASGISVYEFLKRSSVEEYDQTGLAADAAGIIALAEAEGLDAHAASVRRRM